MARRRTHSRRAATARGWETPADIAHALRALDAVAALDLGDNATFRDAVRWAKAHDHRPGEYLAADGPRYSRAMSRLIWEAFRMGICRPANLAQRMTRPTPSATTTASASAETQQLTEPPAPF